MNSRLDSTPQKLQIPIPPRFHIIERSTAASRANYEETIGAQHDAQHALAAPQPTPQSHQTHMRNVAGSGAAAAVVVVAAVVVAVVVVTATAAATSGVAPLMSIQLKALTRIWMNSGDHHQPNRFKGEPVAKLQRVLIRVGLHKAVGVLNLLAKVSTT